MSLGIQPGYESIIGNEDKEGHHKPNCFLEGAFLPVNIFGKHINQQGVLLLGMKIS